MFFSDSLQKYGDFCLGLVSVYALATAWPSVWLVRLSPNSKGCVAEAVAWWLVPDDVNLFVPIYSLSVHVSTVLSWLVQSIVSSLTTLSLTKLDPHLR